MSSTKCFEALEEKISNLHLEKITWLDWHDVEDPRVTKEQESFLPDNVSNLALAGVILAVLNL